MSWQEWYHGITTRERVVLCVMGEGGGVEECGGDLVLRIAACRRSSRTRRTRHVCIPRTSRSGRACGPAFQR